MVVEFWYGARVGDLCVTMITGDYQGTVADERVSPP
jgi:hypothetical protein